MYAIITFQGNILLIKTVQRFLGRREGTRERDWTLGVFQFIEEMQIIRTCQNKEMKLTEQKSYLLITKHLRKSVNTTIVHK